MRVHSAAGFWRICSGCMFAEPPHIAGVRVDFAALPVIVEPWRDSEPPRIVRGHVRRHAVRRVVLLTTAPTFFHSLSSPWKSTFPNTWRPGMCSRSAAAEAQKMSRTKRHTKYWRETVAPVHSAYLLHSYRLSLLKEGESGRFLLHVQMSPLEDQTGVFCRPSDG